MNNCNFTGYVFFKKQDKVKINNRSVVQLLFGINVLKKNLKAQKSYIPIKCMAFGKLAYELDKNMNKGDLVAVSTRLTIVERMTDKGYVINENIFILDKGEVLTKKKDLNFDDNQEVADGSEYIEETTELPIEF